MTERELIDLLNRANYEYHTLDAPTISDAEYDRLYDSLVAMEALHPDTIEADSPTQRVGYKIQDGFKPYHHSAPMYSLEKIHSVEELRAWDSRIKKELGL